MAMYSAVDGVVNEFHLVHFGERALGGAGLLFTEMTCPSPEARITPGCAGLWNDAQVAAWRRVIQFVHAHSDAKFALQLGHSGRKGSTKEPWLDDGRDDADFLRNLLFLPSATVVVAEVERLVVGVGVVSIRPSVRSGPFVGVIDELGIAADALDAAGRRRVADDLVEHLAASAKNKGCTRVEVSGPLVSAEPSLWKRHRFASRGRTLGREVD